MQITRQADYAVRAVLSLSKLGVGERSTTGKIAEEQHIPPSFLSKIISQLTVAGILQTSRGAQGGVILAREPAAITLLEVIEAVDGPVRLNECVGDDRLCPFESECPVRSVWCEVQSELLNRLRHTTFERMASSTLYCKIVDRVHREEITMSKTHPIRLPQYSQPGTESGVG